MVTVFCDIDGVLVNYPSAEFINFINKNSNVEILQEDKIDTIKHKLGRDSYNKLKNEFRRSGIKADLQPIEAAVNCLNELNNFGVRVNVLTSRPIIYENIINTRNWLTKIKLKYDNLYFCREKATFLAVPSTNEHIFVIDDNHMFLKQYDAFEPISTVHCPIGNIGTSNNQVEAFWADLKSLILLNATSKGT